MSKTKEAMEQRIVQFLEEHPDFFRRHPGLLTRLEIPHSQGDAASLLEYQVTSLRQRNEQLEARLRQLVDLAGENERLMGKVHDLLLSLMAQPSLTDAIRTLGEHLDGPLASDHARLLFFSPLPMDKGEEWVQVVDPADEEIEALLRSMDDGQPLCGRLSAQRSEQVFGNAAEAVASAALIALADGRDTVGLLALGSTDASRFFPGMATDFLRQLGQVAGRALTLHAAPRARQAEA